MGGGGQGGVRLAERAAADFAAVAIAGAGSEETDSAVGWEEEATKGAGWAAEARASAGWVADRAAACAPTPPATGRRT